MQRLFSLNTWVVFGFLCVFSIILSFAMRELVVTFDVYYDAFGEQLTWERAEEKYQKRKEWAWLGYVFVPVIFAIKFMLITSCLYAGVFMESISLKFRQLFSVVVVAELLFLLPTLIKVSWFVFVADNYTLQDVIYFSPWALSGFVSITKDTDKLLAYLLQVTNLFEVFYMLLLAFGLQYITQKTYFNALILTLKSYGLGLLLWITFVSFLIVSFS
jgi:hypothetical protein